MYMQYKTIPYFIKKRPLIKGAFTVKVDSYLSVSVLPHAYV